jgi:hypothetical protein
VANLKIGFALNPAQTEMTLTIERGESVRQTTTMIFVASEVDDLITALVTIRNRMLPAPQPIST